MGIWQLKSNRKPTGGKLTLYRQTKRKFELGSEPTKTTVGKTAVARRRTLGGSTKIGLRFAEFANVMDPKAKTCKKVKITSVVENKASVHFTRQGVITKGAIIKTELGDAKVTSRPGQDGIVNAILLK